MLENIKHERFCLHYAKTANATESYKQAGYKPRNDNSAGANARRLLMRDDIKERLQELAEEMAEEKIADIREIHERLTAILRGEMYEEVVVVEGHGQGFSEARIIKKSPALNDRIKAGTELAKMKGGYDNTVKVKVSPITFVEDIDDE